MSRIFLHLYLVKKYLRGWFAGNAFFSVPLVFIFCLILKESISSVFEGEREVCLLSPVYVCVSLPCSLCLAVPVLGVFSVFCLACLTEPC